MRIKTKNSSLMAATGLIVFTALAGPSSAHVISEEDHHAFEHKFAEMCIEREKSVMKGSGVLLSEVTEMCDCIAKEESKRITIEEVRKFVREGKYPVSLMMKSNAATYTCVQKKTP